MKSLLVIAALLLSSGAASAYTPMDCGVFICQTIRANPDAKVTYMEEVRHDDVTDVDRALWAKRCQPRKVFDGLTDRWTYAAKGCSSGPRHE